MEMLDEIDRKITRAMQGDFPLVEEPYKEIAAKVGIGEEELLLRLRRFKENGQIRKMGAVLQHRAAGFTANVLSAWVVPPCGVALLRPRYGGRLAVQRLHDDSCEKPRRV